MINKGPFIEVASPTKNLHQMETKTSYVIHYIIFYVRLVFLSKQEDEGAAHQFHFVWNVTWPSQPTSSQV
jgi:hypothetical protein